MSYITGDRDDVGSFFTATVIRWMFQMMPGWLQINGGVELWMRSLAIKLANNLRSHRSAVSNCLVPAWSIWCSCPSPLFCFRNEIKYFRLETYCWCKNTLNGDAEVRRFKEHLAWKRSFVPHLKSCLFPKKTPKGPKFTTSRQKQALLPKNGLRGIWWGQNSLLGHWANMRPAMEWSSLDHTTAKAKWQLWLDSSVLA